MIVIWINGGPRMLPKRGRSLCLPCDSDVFEHARCVLMHRYACVKCVRRNRVRHGIRRYALIPPFLIAPTSFMANRASARHPRRDLSPAASLVPASLFLFHSSGISFVPSRIARSEARTADGFDFPYGSCIHGRPRQTSRDMLQDCVRSPCNRQYVIRDRCLPFESCDYPDIWYICDGKI